MKPPFDLKPSDPVNLNITWIEELPDYHYRNNTFHYKSTFKNHAFIGHLQSKQLPNHKTQFYLKIYDTPFQDIIDILELYLASLLYSNLPFILTLSNASYNTTHYNYLDIHNHYSRFLKLFP